MIYFASLVLTYALSVLLKLNIWTSLIVVVFALQMTYLHQKRYKKSKMNEQRFYDVSMYLDTLLYAFVKEEKVELAIRDVAQTLSNGKMKELVQKSHDYMTMTFDEVEVLEAALQMIEEEYSCQRIRTVHQFMTHVEYYGGEIEKPVNLLLADKARWEKRIKENMALRKKQFVDVILSAIASICICSAILHLPVTGMDISKQWIVQIGALLVIVFNDMIIFSAQKYVAVDWVSMQLGNDEEYYVEKMEQLKSYNEKKERVRSTVLGCIGLVASGLCLIYGQEWQVILALALSVFGFQQHRVGQFLLRKNLLKEIKYQFPNWLLDLVLLLQSENVQVALHKSEIHVPGILRKDLRQLIERLEMEPEASRPYHMFLEDFAIPEVHSAMGILYSLSIGNSANGDKQISELVEKNLELLDITETELLKNSASGMYLLFLLPVMTASFKLVVDMMMLLLQFIAMPML